MPHSFSPTLRRHSLVFGLYAVSMVVGILSGCSSTLATSAQVSPTAYARISGNWQFSSSAETAAPLPALGGSLTANGSALSGTLHPLSIPGVRSAGNPCAAPSDAFTVSGHIASDGSATLTSAGFAGGTLTFNGTLAPSQQTFTHATYAVSGGPCAMSSSPALAAQYTPVSGTYSGTIRSVSGASAVVSTAFSQTTAPDPNGTFHLQGVASFGTSQTCLSQPVISDSSVTGSTLSATYTQTENGITSSIAVAGVFNTGATTLTLTSYAITGGPCDGDTGSGILSLHP